MSNFRKYIGYFLIYSFIFINGYGFAFAAKYNLNSDSSVPICTSEGIKYLFADGSIADNRNTHIYHNYCMDCISCDSNFYDIYIPINVLYINTTKQKYISFKSKI